MNWNIYFFETSRGEKPVEEFIENLSSPAYAKVLRLLELLWQYGTFLCMPYCKKITKDIYELRVRGKEEIRIFYFFQKRKVYLLHAFKKKSQKTPQNEIKIAEQRMKLLTSV